MFVNQRTLIEYENAEKRIAELEALLEKLGQGKLIQLKTVNGYQHLKTTRPTRASSQ